MQLQCQSTDQYVSYQSITKFWKSKQWTVNGLIGREYTSSQSTTWFQKEIKHWNMIIWLHQYRWKSITSQKATIFLNVQQSHNLRYSQNNYKFFKTIRNLFQYKRIEKAKTIYIENNLLTIKQHAHHQI